MVAIVLIITELFFKTTKNKNHKVRGTKYFSDVQASEKTMELGNVF